MERTEIERKEHEDRVARADAEFLEAHRDAHMELTPRQLAFIEEYIDNGGQVSKASRHAGYKTPQQGSAILSKKVVRRFVAAGLRVSALKSKVSFESVLIDLERAKREALTPYVDSNGNLRRDTGNFIKATELQGKYLKMFSDKVDIEVRGQVATTPGLSDLSDEAIKRMLEIYEKDRSPSDSE